MAALLPRTRPAARMALLTCITAVAALSVPGCANRPTVTATWHENEARGARYSSALVIGLVKDGDKRLSFEDALAQQLSSSDTKLWSSSRVLGSGRAVNRESVSRAVAQTGAEAVFVTRVETLEVRQVETEAYTDVQARRQQGRLFSYDYVEKELPARVTPEFTTTLVTDVYRVGSERHVYSLTATASGQESLEEVIDVLSRAIAKKLRADGIVR